VIRWLEKAAGDLQCLCDYISQDSETAANDVADRVLKAVEYLVECPGMGRPGRLPHTRELVVAGTPYLIPYRVRDGVVEILRVFHCAMQWEDLLVLSEEG
jgi:toxin ParE1/3/4